MSRPQRGAQESSCQQTAGKHKQPLADVIPAQQITDAKAESPEGQARKGGQRIFHSNAPPFDGAHSTKHSCCDQYILNDS